MISKTCSVVCFHSVVKDILLRSELCILLSFCGHRSMTWRVVVGDHDIYTNEGREQYLSVSQVYVHPSWNTNNVAAGSVLQKLNCTHYCTHWLISIKQKTSFLIKKNH